MTARQPPGEKGANACTTGLYQSRDWYFCACFPGNKRERGALFVLRTTYCQNRTRDLQPVLRELLRRLLLFNRFHGHPSGCMICYHTISGKDLPEKMKNDKPCTITHTILEFLNSFFLHLPLISSKIELKEGEWSQWMKRKWPRTF